MITTKGAKPRLLGSIKNRILVFVVLFEITAYGTLQLFNNYVYKNELVELKNREIQQNFAASSEKINNISQLMERNVTDLATVGEHLYQLKTAGLLSMDELEQQSERLLVTNFSGFAAAIGGGIWYEPYSLDKQTELFGPYAFQDKGEVVFSWDLNTPEYNYPKKNWYTIANVAQLTQTSKRDRPIFWTEPYYDEAASFSLMMTVDAVMFDANGKGVGMATVDWSLKELTASLDQVKLSKKAFPFFIYQGAGTFLSYPKDSNMVLKSATAFDWGTEVLNNPEQDKLLTLYDVDIDGQPYNIHYIRTNRGFIFGSLVPISDLEEAISKLTTVTLLAGLLIGLAFITLMILLMRLLFTPFDKVLQLIKGSIKHKGDATVVIEPIDYPVKNEFTPIIAALTEVYQQVTTYLLQISDSKNEIESLNAELEEKVFVRTMQLEKKTHEAVIAFDQLKLTQQQLIENEKQAAQGRLVAGVAHRINTPLGIGVTAASCITRQIDDAFDGMLSGQFKRSQLNDKHQELKAGCQMLNDNLSRAADLIHSFKQLAVDQSSQEFRHFGLKHYISEVLHSLDNTLIQTNHKVVLNCDEQLQAYSQPGAIAQILNNLIDNALLYGLSETENGVIEINVSSIEQGIELTFEDNGKGIAQDVLGLIFDPFFTTSKDEGRAGLGLQLVYSLVTQKLNGSITCESELGEGTKFVIVLPS
jgi:signal transduction histidine kinase